MLLAWSLVLLALLIMRVDMSIKNVAKTGGRDKLELAIRILLGLVLIVTILVISVGFAPPAVPIAP